MRRAITWCGGWSLSLQEMLRKLIQLVTFLLYLSSRKVHAKRSVACQNCLVVKNASMH